LSDGGTGEFLGARNYLGRFGLTLALCLIHKLLSQEKCALKGLVRNWVSLNSLGRGFLARLFQMSNTLRRLPQAFRSLTKLLVKSVCLDGGLFQVLVDLVDVVPLEPETKLDASQGLQGRLGLCRAVHKPRL
jgi:hypothetical protein